MKDYNHLEVEKKWQKYWDENKTFRAVIDDSKKKYYVMDMFPYPSGAGLHVGHPEGYTATDIISRMMRRQGFNVLHPMGWDAFGLPAENYAIETGIHPRIATDKNIATFKRQIKSLGFSYDWDREIDSTDPNYYKWSQWIFLKLYEHGLAYEKKMPMAWCAKCKIVVANEEVEDGRHERCGNFVEKKNLRQWMLKITKYADRLLDDLDELDWPEKIKLMQKNWIGRSYGAELDFPIDGKKEKIRVYTTRPDTLFGCTYMVLAPEHPLLETCTSKDRKKDVDEYVQKALSKSERDRKIDEKEKTGVFSGTYAINPVNNKKIPIWIADYVLIDYGTGAIMAVPGHDIRDNEFAEKFGLDVIQVVEGTSVSNLGIVLDGVSINSDFLNGLKTSDAKEKMIEWLEKKKLGKRQINYKLRDWIFTRQRYWGEPIPLVHCSNCGVVPINEKELPLLLPEVLEYEPTGTGESPIASISEWVNIKCPKCGGNAKRETSTMPNWAGSSWYWLRYMDPNNDKKLVDKEIEKYWGPVDLYVGGAEHAVLHLLYSRFWHKFLFDIGVVNTKEPFIKLRNQGMILGEDGEKMSKSRGNVVNPDLVVQESGADTLRLYEMFMGPFDQTVLWNSKGVTGVRRFLERVWRLRENVSKDAKEDSHLESVLHKTIKKVTSDTENFKFNTAISAIMIFVNEMYKFNKISQKYYASLLSILNPYAPHITEELWESIGNKKPLTEESWPSFNESLCKEDMITVAIQVNGKLRDKISVPIDISEKEVLKLSKESEKIKKYLSGKIVKEIYVKCKLVSIVVK